MEKKELTIQDILAVCDHTILKPDTTIHDIYELCSEAMKFNTASVCIPPCFIKQARDFFKWNKSDMRICTVVGFPNGYAMPYAKVREADEALSSGADEIDMVINIGYLKSEEYHKVLNEIEEVKKACEKNILKVIIETCLLTEQQKIVACVLASSAGADFVKTSTGFSTGGATVADVKLLKQHVSNGVKVKAAGGISSIEDAKALIEAGADRLGTSKIVKIAKEVLLNDTANR